MSVYTYIMKRFIYIWMLGNQASACIAVIMMLHCVLSYMILRYTRTPINVKIQKYTTDHSTLNKTMLVTWFYRPDWFPKHFNNAQCTFKNCIFSDERTQLNKSRAVLFYHRFLSNIVPKRNPNQLWILLDFESPMNDDPLPEMWNKQFDFFHTYLTDSDILRRQSVKLRSNTLDRNYSLIYKQKTKLSAWLVSNCRTHSKRDKYAKELQKYINIDVYGACGTNNSLCKDLTYKECHIILSQNYKFYIGFENTICKDYITEKLADSYEENHNAIVVYRGAPNVNDLFPSNTFIDVNDFKSIKYLAQYMIRIASSEEKYTSLLRQKHKYRVNEPHSYCSICEWLNKNSNLKPVHTKRDFNKWFRENKCENIQG